MSIINICIFLYLVVSLHSLNAQILYTWSQVIPESKLSIRAIINHNDCPIIDVDGSKIKMLNRTTIHDYNHTEAVCELVTEASTKNINIENMKIPTLPKKINKIAFIGDTGCRVNTFLQQECNSLNSWPLKKNLDSITSHKPDLIIHLGDYHYRKTKCRNRKKCGNIHGYNKEAWYADWFNPAKNVSQQAPFLFIRGNHENCNRAHGGWFRYLDPYPFLSKKCKNFIPSWHLDIGPIKFFIFDSSSNENIFTIQDKINAFESKFNEITKDYFNKPTWFLTHKPFFKFPIKNLFRLKNFSFIQTTDSENRFLKNINTIVSGHIHIAQIILMSDAPDQIIVGNGGALLHFQDQEPSYQNVKCNYTNGRNHLAHAVKNFFGFGFAILNLENQKFTFYNQDNKNVYSAMLTKNFKIKK